MTLATDSNSTDTTNASSEKNEEYPDLSPMEEHELDYKRRRKRIEFTEDSNSGEL